LIGRRVFRAARALLAALAILVAPFSNAAPAGKPKLILKATPATGTPSTLFLFQAILTGGDDSEDYYCLGIEWIWEEQLDSSLNEAECPAYRPGETKIDRSFSEEQTFHTPGPHVVKVVLRKGEKQIATASVTVRVRDEP
jgi:hypothetical protein